MHFFLLLVLLLKDYNPLTLASNAIFLHFQQSPAMTCLYFIPITFKSLHLVCGLPFISCSFHCIYCNLLGICLFCILSTWPHHLTWGEFINYTISALLTLPLSHFFPSSPAFSALVWVYIFS